MLGFVLHKLPEKKKLLRNKKVEAPTGQVFTNQVYHS